MGMTIQIAVKLPNGMVDAIDRLIAEGRFTSRSQAVRSALDVLVDHHRSRDIDAAFSEGFGRHPESAEDMADATRLAVEAIEDEPWERWW